MAKKENETRPVKVTTKRGSRVAKIAREALDKAAKLSAKTRLARIFKKGSGKRVSVKMRSPQRTAELVKKAVDEKKAEDLIKANALKELEKIATKGGKKKLSAEELKSLRQDKAIKRLIKNYADQVAGKKPKAISDDDIKKLNTRLGLDFPAKDVKKDVSGKVSPGVTTKGIAKKPVTTTYRSGKEGIPVQQQYFGLSNRMKGLIAAIDTRVAKYSPDELKSFVQSAQRKKRLEEAFKTNYAKGAPKANTITSKQRTEMKAAFKLNAGEVLGLDLLKDKSKMLEIYKKIQKLPPNKRDAKMKSLEKAYKSIKFRKTTKPSVAKDKPLTDEIDAEKAAPAPDDTKGLLTFRKAEGDPAQREARRKGIRKAQYEDENPFEFTRDEVTEMRKKGVPESGYGVATFKKGGLAKADKYFKRKVLK